MNQDLAIFQLLLERMVRYLPLQDAVKEVSRYAMENFDRQWLDFIHKYPNSSDEVLRILAQYENWWVRMAIAKRGQDLPNEVLRVLAQDQNEVVRWVVANRKQDINEDILKILAQDEGWKVREAVAGRKDLSEDLLKTLAQDEDGRVQKAAKRKLSQNY